MLQFHIISDQTTLFKWGYHSSSSSTTKERADDELRRQDECNQCYTCSNLDQLEIFWTPLSTSLLLPPVD